jgi:ribA/ribD-fused uncharacterized protein
MNEILEFTGDYSWLSNFHTTPISWWGKTYASVEHAYQASKCQRIEDRDLFLVGSARDAKRMGGKVMMLDCWEEMKVDVMRRLLVEKFCSRVLRRSLLLTGSAKLVEGNRWHDTFWGVDLATGKGQNLLGKLLMGVRELYRIDRAEKNAPLLDFRAT